MSCGLNAQANILPLPTLSDAITSVYNTHFTYTSHPKETLLSSSRKRNTSPLRGRRKENNPVNCFLTTGAELLICDPAAATEANVTVAADRSKLYSCC